MAGIEAARSDGQEAVYGNFLRGNGADSLFLLGRWDESRQLGETALEWSPVGINFVNAVANLAIVEIEVHAGERAGRLLGRLLLELETVPDAQESVPAYQAAASFALWRGDLGDAQRAVELGWGRVRHTEDWVLVAKMAASVLEIDAWAVADARDRRDLPALARARQRAGRCVEGGRDRGRAAGVAKTIGSRREADAFIADGARVLRPARRPRRIRRPGTPWPGRWEALGDPVRRGARPVAPGRGAPSRPATGGRVEPRHVGRCSRPSGSPASSAPARSCASSRSSPAAPGSRSPRPRWRGGRVGSSTAGSRVAVWPGCDRRTAVGERWHGRSVGPRPRVRGSGPARRRRRSA